MNFEDLDLNAEGLPLDELGRKHFQVIKQITPEKFEKFLIAKMAKATCLSCGSGRLFVPHTIIHSADPDSENYDENDDLIYVSPKAESDTPFRIYTARYEVCCQNCGFVYQYQAYPVIKWAMKNEGVTGELI